MLDKERQKPKNWWGAIWRGIVVDEKGKHYRHMGSAVWLFIYLLIHADRKAGSVRRKYTTIAHDMNVSEGTIRNWMRRLRRHQYVTAVSTGRGLLIHIRRWKTYIAAERVSGVAPPD